MRVVDSWFSSNVSLLLASALLLACSSDEGDNQGTAGTGATGGTGAAGGSGGGGSGGGGGTDAGAGGTSPGTCTTTVEPSADDSEVVQTALIEASSGDTICFAPGTYSFARELSLATALDVTLRGTGESREDVVLDFADQQTGDDGMDVTADGFTIENLWIKNTAGNGITVKADDSTFRNIKVSWDAGSVTENGAYAVYPTNCNRTVLEDIEVTGASDAGIYVGQCQQAIIRNCKAYANVLGIEVENTIDAEVHDNEAYDNTGGILIDLLPNKQLKESHNALIRDNIIRDNNRPNFAPPGGVIAGVPRGTGIMVLAASDTEIRNNNISGNGGAAILVVSYMTVGVLLNQPSNDPDTDQFPKRTFIHENTFSGNGTAEVTDAGTDGLDPAYQLIGVSPLEDVLWDGFLDDDPALNITTDADMQLCLGTTEQGTFRNFNLPGGLTLDVQKTDPTPHQCTLPALPDLSF